MNREDSSYDSFRGHEAPILGLALNSQETQFVLSVFSPFRHSSEQRRGFQASSSCDGTVRIWALKKRGEGADSSQPSREPLKVLPDLWPKTNDVRLDTSPSKPIPASSQKQMLGGARRHWAGWASTR